MHKKSEVGFVDRVYQKWVSANMNGFHVLICLIAVSMYLLGAMLLTDTLKTAAYILFFVNVLLFLVYWNQSQLYRFSNQSRNVKNLPSNRIAGFNKLYFSIFICVFLAVLFLMFLLPLGEVKGGISEVAYNLISAALIKVFGRSEHSSKVENKVHNSYGNGELKKSTIWDRTFLDSAEQVMVYIAVAAAVVFFVLMLVYVFKNLKAHLNLELEENVTRSKEIVTREKVTRERRSFFESADPDSKIRRLYRKKVLGLAGRKGTIETSWTPSEIEENVQIKEAFAEHQKIHDLYEKARYQGASCSEDDVAQMKSWMKKEKG